MSSELFRSPLMFASIVFAIVGVILLFGATAALRRAKPLGFVLRTLSALVLLCCALLSIGLAIGLQGYRALTHEEVAARIAIKPVAPQRFTATVHFADGREAEYELTGDEIYIDAQILKWHPHANLLGLHTAYEFDRLAGRYRALEQERSAPRSVHSLAQEKPVDVFALRQRHQFLAPIVDAQYGSATFVPADRPAEYEVRVSTTGLLMREILPTQRQQ